MKKILHLTCVHAGAATNAALIDYEDGIARAALPNWTANKRWGITKITMTGAVALGFTIIRGGHVGDNVTVPVLSFTLAGVNKTVDLVKLLGGAGLVVDLHEVVNFQSIGSGAGTTDITVELDDSIAVVNARGPRVAGAAAAVANVPTETLANLRATLGASDKYSLRAMYTTSTSILNLIMRWTGQTPTVQSVNGCGALGAGLSNYVLLDTPITGLGSVFGTDVFGDIICTAADAAAVQDIFALFTTN